MTLPVIIVGICWKSKKRSMLQWIYRCMIYIIGVRITVQGRPSNAETLLIVSNHISYMDIPIIGSCVQASFIAKSEVATWPVISWLAYLCDTIYVERKITKTKKNIEHIALELSKERALVIFPEGTTGLGETPLPFKTSFFQVMENDHVKESLVFQPMSIRYTHINNKKISDEERESVAWVGDAELLPHLWDFLKFKSIQCEVVFHPAFKANEAKTRRDAAEKCSKLTAQGFSNE